VSGAQRSTKRRAAHFKAPTHILGRRVVLLQTPEVF
jgi:hypothetical protein